MGKLVEGRWQPDWYDTKSTGGKFIREDSVFRGQITPDGKADSPQTKGFKAEAGRYHLYISLACPWAHRAMIFRELKGLQDFISVSSVNSYMGENGWTFHPGDGVISDDVNNKTFLYEIYKLAQSDFTGRVTVPVLWDKVQKTIVNNESSEIIRMFNTAFDHLGATPGDYYPEKHRKRIDELNDLIYDNVNNGVYKSGFATTQSAYDDAVKNLFETLDYLEELLNNSCYLIGSTITEADWRLFTTLIRFDVVYVNHFKCNIRRIKDYPALSNYVRDLYQQPGVSQTVNFSHIKAHYFGSHSTINPTGIIPAGPKIDFNRPHNRHKF